MFKFNAKLNHNIYSDIANFTFIADTVALIFYESFHFKVNQIQSSSINNLKPYTMFLFQNLL